MKTAQIRRIIIISGLQVFGVANAGGEPWTVVAATGVSDNEVNQYYDVMYDRTGIHLNPQHQVAACTYAYYNVTATPGFIGKPGARLTARFTSSKDGRVSIWLQQTALNTGLSSTVITLQSGNINTYGEQIAEKDTCGTLFSGFNFSDNAYHLIVQLCSKKLPKENPIFKLAKIDGIDCTSR